MCLERFTVIQSIPRKTTLSYTQKCIKMILNSLENSTLTNTMNKKETCLSQSPEQNILFIFCHITTRVKIKLAKIKL